MSDVATDEKASIGPVVTQPALPSPVKAWAVVGLLLAIYTVSFIDRQIIGILVAPIKRDLELSDTSFSLLSGLAFAIFYTGLGIPFARIADSGSRKWLITFGVAFWSLATAACGLARNFSALFAARICVGVGEATLTPAANSMIPDMFAPERVGRAISIYTLGIPVGSALAFIFGGAVVGYVSDLPPQTLPLFGEIRGWQLAFMIVGLPGVLLAVVMAMVKEPHRRGRISEEGKGLPLKDVIGYLWHRKMAYFPLFLGSAMKSILGYGVFTWVVAYFGRVHGIEASVTGATFGTLLLTFGTAGILCGPWLVERLMAKGTRDAHPKVLFYSGLAYLPLGLAFPLVSDPTLSWVMLAIAIFFSQFPWSTSYAAIATITPNEIRGQATAVYLFIVNIFGLGIGPTVFALFTDLVFRDEMLIHYSIAATVALVAPISLLSFWIARKPFALAFDEAMARNKPASVEPKNLPSDGEQALV